jgi:hypothetical protein
MISMKKLVVMVICVALCGSAMGMKRKKEDEFVCPGAPKKKQKAMVLRKSEASLEVSRFEQLSFKSVLVQPYWLDEAKNAINELDYDRAMKSIPQISSQNLFTEQIGFRIIGSKMTEMQQIGLLGEMSRRGADLTEIDYSHGGWSHLNFAVTQNNPEVARYLIAEGSKPNARDGEGRRPLFLAEDEIMVKTLLECGADQSKKDMYGRTVLHYNAGVSPEQRKIAYQLVKNGGSAQAGDNNGFIPVAYHSQCGEGPVNTQLEDDVAADAMVKRFHIAEKANKNLLRILFDRSNGTSKFKMNVHQS